jgi:hypothetical protein
MSYYRVEDIAVPPPPPPPEADPPAALLVVGEGEHAKRDRDYRVAEWKKEQARLHKAAVDEHKVRVEKQAALTKEVGEYVYAVRRNDNSGVVCMCQGKEQADYIAMLLGDRPRL